MAIPLHLWLTDQDGSDIRGSSAVSGRDGSIEVLSFSHGIHIPADASTGKLIGVRSHDAMVVEKEIDRSTPLLYRAAAKGATLRSATLKWYRIDESGLEREYFRITMADVKVTCIMPRVANIKDSATATQNHVETVGLRYGKSRDIFVPGNLTCRCPAARRWHMELSKCDETILRKRIDCVCQRDDYAHWRLVS
jgi:type VI secretion system secreted protein Hcp